MAKDKICESCGMPMRSKEDFGGGDENNKYCVHCTYENGELKSFEDAFSGMKNFMMRTMGVSEAEAEKGAKEGMAKMPAWKKYF